jgi:hypothetical protein
MLQQDPVSHRLRRVARFSDESLITGRQLRQLLGNCSEMHIWRLLNREKLRALAFRFGTTPPTSKAPDRPDFHRGLGFARRFARKGREIAPVYAGWDDVKVILLGTSPLAEPDSGPFMTTGPDPPWIICGDPP